MRYAGPDDGQWVSRQPDPLGAPEPYWQKRKPKRWPWVLVGLAVLLLVGCTGMWAILSGAGPSNNGIDVPAATSAAGVPKAGAAPKGNALPNTVGEGMWRVGKDIPAGKYRTNGASDPDFPLCYWHVAADDGDDHIKTQGVNDSPNQPGLVTLKTGQYFKTSGCKDWVKQ